MNKTILITGAGSGFGKGVAFGLAKKGHHVIATVENWPQKSLLMAAAKAENIQLTIDKLNYLEEGDIDNVIGKYGDEVDIVVLNAATGETGPIAEVPVKRIQRVFEVNVFQTIAIAQRFAKIFVAKKKGKIVFTSSIAGFITFPFLGPYVASKHALEGLVQSMQQEMADTGVKIATINPGPFRTGFNDRMYDTVDQWYDPSQNFTKEQPIRDVQQLFAGDELQLDPQGMIDYMIEKIPLDAHNFRNVFPEEAIADVKKYQDSLWNKQIG
ncbi:SDR family oxidoreductase [Microscilla marina]|uniref:Short chain dehydrogenase n=1 Tax=Microscilla marina ATCC 23134 TaxID=313606 RepID=A1ZQN2_MICM2|nr:SDR family oxidoreductase [Microscilla marina]EAY27404.1 short chain dehydrogenase [Microscilla marina ATCC 23134]